MRSLDICRMQNDHYDHHDFPEGTLVMLIHGSPGSGWHVERISNPPTSLAWVDEDDMKYVTSVGDLVQGAP